MMGIKICKSSLSALLLAFHGLICMVLVVGRAQAKSNATDPIEVSVFRGISNQWKIQTSASWNLTQPCSGTAVDSASSIDNPLYNPAIKCDCLTMNNKTICHITHLKVSGMSLTGRIPEAIGNLTFLVYLNLGNNFLAGPLPASIGSLTSLKWLTLELNSLNGIIIPEVGKLKNLLSLNLNQNYLSGPLPAFIGNLTSLQYLACAMNPLSGPLPRELGNLQSLLSLAISSNNFSGPLPPELGNLTNIQSMYIDSAGFSGPIPSTFASLQNMTTLLASDNAFTRKIPDFIGNWTNLNTLRFQGNTFEGPIPSTFSNLTLMTDLRISELSNGSTSFTFVKDMKSLTILTLRNSMMSGTIPSDIWSHPSLERLDLSFNKLSGQIPSSLFNLTSLAYLFLGNNLLSGAIPPQKSSRLLHIDLSYNNLSGSVPSWVGQTNLELNLVGNEFSIDSSDGRFSALPSGLSCLQKNFPCNKNPPIYSSFAINCGGLELKTDAETYDSDNETLGASSYYMVNTQRWAVSSNGIFREASSPFTQTSSSTISKTAYPMLYASSRLSPGSLRYYGLGLDNGNYSVNLQFSEIVFPNSPTWQSLGRRVFDIYIQGNLVEKDFNIRKEAGGLSNTAVSKYFTANVSQNFLEIHLFWSGKGTCCIPNPNTFGPSISAIHVTSDFPSNVSNVLPRLSSSKKIKTQIILGVLISAGIIMVASILAIIALKRQRKKLLLAYANEELQGLDAKPNIFSYSEIKTATGDFKPENKLGEGGFGPVYKGTLSDGRMVAIKQLSITSLQGRREFLTEIGTISAVQHRNLVKLYGCCLEEDKRVLVYEYLENNSLEQALFGNSRLELDWPTRFNICLGTARGLAYLHQESRLRIVHRDVKASNILLDGELNAKISDFGMAKLFDDRKTHISTRVAGTIGYLAPEYALRGHLTEKVDVFGFGVVILEIVSGRPNADNSLDRQKIYLLEWAWHLRESNNELELVDPTLTEYDKGEAGRVIGVALLCTQSSPALRPSMSRVVAMLSGDIDVHPATSKPAYLTDWHLNDQSSILSMENTLSTTTGTTDCPLHSDFPISPCSGAETSPLNETNPILLHHSAGGR